MTNTRPKRYSIRRQITLDEEHERYLIELNDQFGGDYSDSQIIRRALREMHKTHVV